MRAGIRITIVDEMKEHSQEIIAKSIKDEFKSQLLRGNRLMDLKIKIGYDGDDFIKNQFTVICYAKVYKVPRFVRNYLLKKKYEVRRIKH